MGRGGRSRRRCALGLVVVAACGGRSTGPDADAGSPADGRDGALDGGPEGGGARDGASDAAEAADRESGDAETDGGVRLGVPCADAFEGPGTGTVGGAGGDVYHVTTLADDGAGSLRAGVGGRAGPRTIVFDVAGTIALATPIAIREPFLTIDGCAAPSPGVTLQPTPEDIGAIAIGNTHDVVLRNLRIEGQWDPGEPVIEGTGLLTLDGETNRNDGVVFNVVVDHVTIVRGNDLAFGVWGESHDVTFSWSLIAWTRKATTTSYHSGPVMTLTRITYHHNVLARNGERNPQIRNDVGVLTEYGFYNNVVYEWGYLDDESGRWDGYGTRFGREGESPVSGSFIGNVYASTTLQANAFLRPGVPGEQWFEDNVFPAGATIPTSTVAARPAMPAGGVVGLVSSASLGASVVPWVGVRDRTLAEDALLAEISGAL